MSEYGAGGGAPSSSGAAQGGEAGAEFRHVAEAGAHGLDDSVHSKMRGFVGDAVDAAEGEMHNGVAMHAHKGLGREGLGPRREGAADEVARAAGERELGVVVAGGDDGDGGERDEARRARAGFHMENIGGGEPQRLRAGRGGLSGGSGKRGDGTGRGREAREGFGEADGVDGLEEVVEGVDGEGAQGVAVVARGKNNPGAGAHIGHEIEAGAAAELNIEEDDVVVGAGELRARFDDGAGLADDGGALERSARAWRRKSRAGGSSSMRRMRSMGRAGRDRKTGGGGNRSFALIFRRRRRMAALAGLA